MINIINLRSINDKWGSLPRLAVELATGKVRAVRWQNGRSRQRPATALDPQDRQLMERITRDLERYCAGDLGRFDWPLDWSQGTPFQRQVWKTLQEIPPGETRSYQWLARQIRRPRSARAVGQANGANPFSLVVPCHRIIRADGSIGGYSSGLTIKKKLLELEKP